jgi:hypothetical protein
VRGTLLEGGACSAENADACAWETADGAVVAAPAAAGETAVMTSAIALTALGQNLFIVCSGLRALGPR